eukprot:gene13173-30658_t
MHSSGIDFYSNEDVMMSREDLDVHIFRYMLASGIDFYSNEDVLMSREVQDGSELRVSNTCALFQSIIVLRTSAARSQSHIKELLRSFGARVGFRKKKGKSRDTCNFPDLTGGLENWPGFAPALVDNFATRSMLGLEHKCKALGTMGVADARAAALKLAAFDHILVLGKNMMNDVTLQNGMGWNQSMSQQRSRWSGLGSIEGEGFKFPNGTLDELLLFGHSLTQTVSSTDEDMHREAQAVIDEVGKADEQRRKKAVQYLEQQRVASAQLRADLGRLEDLMKGRVDRGDSGTALEAISKLARDSSRAGSGTGTELEAIGRMARDSIRAGSVTGTDLEAIGRMARDSIRAGSDTGTDLEAISKLARDSRRAGSDTGNDLEAVLVEDIPVEAGGAVGLESVLNPDTAIAGSQSQAQPVSQEDADMIAKIGYSDFGGESDQSVKEEGEEEKEGGNDEGAVGLESGVNSVTAIAGSQSQAQHVSQEDADMSAQIGNHGLGGGSDQSGKGVQEEQGGQDRAASSDRSVESSGDVNEMASLAASPSRGVPVSRGEQLHPASRRLMAERTSDSVSGTADLASMSASPSGRVAESRGEQLHPASRRLMAERTSDLVSGSADLASMSASPSGRVAESRGEQLRPASRRLMAERISDLVSGSADLASMAALPTGAVGQSSLAMSDPSGEKGASATPTEDAGAGAGGQPSLLSDSDSGSGASVSSTGAGAGGQPSLVSNPDSGSDATPSPTEDVGADAGGQPSLVPDSDSGSGASVSSAGAGAGGRPSLVSDPDSGRDATPSPTEDVGAGAGGQPSLAASVPSVGRGATPSPKEDAGAGAGDQPSLVSDPDSGSGASASPTDVGAGAGGQSSLAASVPSVGRGASASLPKHQGARAIAESWRVEAEAYVIGLEDEFYETAEPPTALPWQQEKDLYWPVKRPGRLVRASGRPAHALDGLKEVSDGLVKMADGSVQSSLGSVKASDASMQSSHGLSTASDAVVQSSLGSVKDSDASVQSPHGLAQVSDGFVQEGGVKEAVERAARGEEREEGEEAGKGQGGDDRGVGKEEERGNDGGVGKEEEEENDRGVGKEEEGGNVGGVRKEEEEGRGGGDKSLEEEGKAEEKQRGVDGGEVAALLAGNSEEVSHPDVEAMTDIGKPFKGRGIAAQMRQGPISRASKGAAIKAKLLGRREGMISRKVVDVVGNLTLPNGDFIEYRISRLATLATKREPSGRVLVVKKERDYLEARVDEQTSTKTEAPPDTLKSDQLKPRPLPRYNLTEALGTIAVKGSADAKLLLFGLGPGR